MVCVSYLCACLYKDRLADTHNQLYESVQSVYMSEANPNVETNIIMSGPVLELNKLIDEEDDIKQEPCPLVD